MVIAFLVLSCQSTKSTVSSSGKSETMAMKADCLDSCLMMNTLNNWLTLSVESLIISKPPAAGNGSTGITERSTAQPTALKIYGIHVDAGNNVNAVKQSSSKETVAEAADSFESEEDIERKTAPSSAPRYIFYILLIAVAIGIYHKLRS